jgi:hypothetical protein
MNIKRMVTVSILASAGLTAAAYQRAQAAIIDRTCRSDFIPVTHVQECNSANLVFQVFPTTFPNPSATRITNKLFVISSPGAGIVTDGRDVNKNRISTCSTGVNRDITGAPKTDSSGCGGMAFHQTFVQL